MPRKNKIPRVSVAKGQAKAETLDFKDKNIVLDLSFPYLYFFVEFNDYTNKFKSARSYISYIDYLNATMFKKISETKYSAFVAKDSTFSRHVHTVNGKELNKIKKIISAAYLENTGDTHAMENFADQNIKDSEIWEIGFENDKGRIFGCFTENVFKPILLDPHHLIYKEEEKGVVRRHKDVKNYKFFPKKIPQFQYGKECIHCGRKTNLEEIKDTELNYSYHICDKCLIEILEKQ